MNIDDYNKLITNDKANILWDKGTHIDERVIYNKHTVVMYALFNFYVEVYYSVKDNKIKEIKALKSDEDWEGYLKSIKLEHL